jgi:trehalose synthase
MTAARTSDLWWKNAVIYSLDVETFLDCDGDGIGDFTGLTERVDHLAGLGVTCLWLMPFYPSPNRDDGYDVVDYYGVQDTLGTLGDLVVFLRTAKDRGMRVIVDLVANHTSDQHPWFQAARADRDSPYREFYVWRDEHPPEPHAESLFPDVEDSVWSFDDEAGQWYLHHFYSHQPDLNLSNPAVREEIAKIAGFWLELGVDGFRVDAVPYLLELEPIEGEVDLDPHGFMRDLRSFVSRRSGSAVLLGEVNREPEPLRTFFGDEDGDELHLVFNFPVNQVLYLALARADARPLVEILERLPEIPDDCQWATFVRNHDELTLDQLSDSERQEVFDAFGPDEDMQIHGRGLRRRLPPMLDNDQRRIRLVYSLLFSLPGTPVLYYGEEIGMGENLEIEGRRSVRTPMQWSSGPNAGFSSAPPSELRRPVVEGEYGPDSVNVLDHRRDPDSLLHWMEEMIRRRRETPELGWSPLRVLDSGDHAVLVHRADWEGRSVVVFHNLSPEPRSVRIEVDAPEGFDCLVDLLDDHNDAEWLDEGAVEVHLEGYDHRWFRLQPADRAVGP